MAFTRRVLRAILLLAFLAGSGAGVHAAESSEQTMLVFAAVSMTDVLQEIGAAYTEQTKQPLRFSFAASSTLARQIEVGASAEVFVSADVEWMDYLQKRGRIDASSRRDIVGNKLVLVAPGDNELQLRIQPNFRLGDALGRGRLAIGDPDIVPAGRYARAALTTLGVWDEVAKRLVFADNVRTALAYVARGETPLGIVYATDARVEKRIRIVDTFPSDTHPPIVYPAAATTDARPGAREFLKFLAGARAQEVFRRHGFLPIASAR
jgi:molybdate transport system substrate-binding protein